MALPRISTIISQRLVKMAVGSGAPTRSSSPYDVFNDVCKFEKDSVDLIETSKHSDDVGTWIGVTLR